MSEGTNATAGSNTTTQTGSGNQGNRVVNQNIAKSSGQDNGRGTGGRDSSTQGADKPATGEAPKKYQFKGLKINGKELDFEADEEQVKRYIQQAHGANTRYEEAKRLREEAEQRNAEYVAWKRSQEEHKKVVSKDPMVAIRKAVQEAIDAGVDPEQARAAGEKWVLENIQRDEESPEAKRARLAEERLAQKEAEEQKRNQTEQERRLAEAAQEERKKIVPEMIKFMDVVGMARTAANLSAVAKRLKVAAERKVPLSIERAVQMQHEDNSTFVKTTVGGQAKAINDAFRSNDTEAVLKVGREVENFLGEEVLVALQRYGIVKWKTKTPNMPHQVVDTAKSKTTEEPQEMSWEEVVEQRKKRAAEIDRQRRGAATGQ